MDKIKQLEEDLRRLQRKRFYCFTELDKKVVEKEIKSTKRKISYQKTKLKNGVYNSVKVIYFLVVDGKEKEPLIEKFNYHINELLKNNIITHFEYNEYYNDVQSVFTSRRIRNKYEIEGF